jgi:hypothetical protein
LQGFFSFSAHFSDLVTTSAWKSLLFGSNWEFLTGNILIHGLKEKIDYFGSCFVTFGPHGATP